MEVLMKDEREDVQKKTFAKWINSQLVKGQHPPVTDLFYDLRDGTRLLALLEVLTGRTFKREKGRMRVHHLNNVSRALAVLEENNVKLVNISNEHIVDGSAKLTLGLVWAVILHWQVQGVLKDVMSDLQQTNLEKTLLAWCRQTTKGYHGVDVRNFTTCWSDGLAFNALIHSHRPQLFEWTVVARKHPYARLENAFRIANEHLGIERLLDPEDVNSQVPDKKSVMMYVMCLFQALPHDSFSVESLDASLGMEAASLSPESLGATAEIGGGKGRPLSTVSIGLGGYQRTLEEVLTWLLGAEDRLAGMPPIADSTDSVKEQFHDLEELMLDLTSKQGGIGDVLGEGSRLLREGVMEDEEEEEVRVQMKLLNTRWEELRVRAMDRQSRLHERLMSLQERQLESLKKWLTETEDRIANMSQVGPTTEALKQQIAAHQQLQHDLESEQSNINSLSNMVVVVDETNSDSVYSSLEDELNALGERWTHICRWTESRWSTLQTLSMDWRKFEEELGYLREWLQEKEKVLRQFESEPATDETQVLRHASSLQVLEAEMEAQQRRFDRLQDLSSKILIHIPEDSAAQGTVPAQLEDVQDRLDLLPSIVEAQTSRLAASGIDIHKVTVPMESGGASGGAEVVRSSTTTITSKDSSTTLITKVVTTKVTETISGSSVKRQKLEGGSQEDFSVALTKLGEWMEGVEDKAKTGEVEQLSLHQLSLLHQQLQTEMESQKEEYRKVVSLGQSAISETATIGESASESERLVQGVAERWKALTLMLEEIKCRTTFLTTREEVTTAIGDLQKRKEEMERFLKEEERKEVEYKIKMEEVEKCEVEIEALRGKVDGLEGRWMEEKQVLLQTVEENLSDWRKLRERLQEKMTIQEEVQPESMEVTASPQLETAPLPQPPQTSQTQEAPHPLQKAVATSREWLQGLEATLRSGNTPIVHTLPIMEERLAELKALQQKVDSERANMERIKTTSAEVFDKGTVPVGCEGLEGDVSNLTVQWDDTTRTLAERIDATEKAIKKLKQYEDEVSGLKSWLAEVEVFLKAEEAALGDIDTLEAQLEQSNALQDDIATLNSNMTNITSNGTQLVEDAKLVPVEGGGVPEDSEAFSTTLKEQLEALQQRWEAVTQLAILQNRSLKEALARSQKVHQDINDLSLWLDELERRIPPSTATTTTIATPDQLTTMADTFNALRQEVTAKGADLTALNNIGDEMLRADSLATHEDLARRFTQLNGRWTEATARIDSGHKLMSDLKERFDDFSKLCKEEEDWLNQLQEKLEGSSKDAADAEEISEALDELELFLHSHDEGRLERIQQLAQGLIGDSCVVETVQHSTAALTSRFNTLNAQAHERQSGLEGRIQEAQAWEREYVSVLDILSQTDATLTQAITDQTLNLDLPQIASELSSQKSVLQKMQSQVLVYRGEGKTEAAVRLEDQVTHLQHKYEEAEMKLQLCQKPSPSDYDRRLQRTEEQLQEIGGGVDQLHLTSGNPDTIQEQLTHCMALYQTLSEVKGEVEEVIATGRKIVKEGQCSDPSDLTSKLDQVKALYNQLGGAVTEHRGTLERALRHTRKMTKDAQQLEEWLTSTEAELDQREASVPTKNLQAEVHFVQHALEDLSRRKPLLVGVQEALTSISKEPGHLPALEERVNDLTLTWERVTTRLSNRLVNMQSEQAVKEAEMEGFIVGLGEVKGWLESTETQLATLHTLSPQEQERLVKAISSEAQQYKGQIDDIHSTSQALINHGVLFQARVQPEIELISDRWERIYHALQHCLHGKQATTTTISSTTTKTITTKTTSSTTSTQDIEVKKPPVTTMQSVAPATSSATTTTSPAWVEDVVKPLVSHNLVEEKVEAAMFSSSESNTWGDATLVDSVVRVGAVGGVGGIGGDELPPPPSPPSNRSPTTTSTDETDGGGKKVSLVEVEEVKMTISHLLFNIPSSHSSSPTPELRPAPCSSRKASEGETDLDALIAGLQEVAKGAGRGRTAAGLVVRPRGCDEDDLESLASIDTDMAPASEASRDLEATFSDLESVSESVTSSRGGVGPSGAEEVTVERVSQQCQIVSSQAVPQPILNTSPIPLTASTPQATSTPIAPTQDVAHPSKAVGRGGAGELPVEELEAMIAELEEVMSEASSSSRSDDGTGLEGETAPLPPPSTPPPRPASPQTLLPQKGSTETPMETESAPLPTPYQPLIPSTETPVNDSIPSPPPEVQSTPTTPTDAPHTPTETPPTPIEFSIQEVHVGGHIEFARGSPGQHDTATPPRLPHVVVTTTTTDTQDDAYTLGDPPPCPTPPDAPQKVSIHSSQVVHGMTVVTSSGNRLPEAQRAVRVTLISQPGSVEALEGGKLLEEEEEEEEVSSFEEEAAGGQKDEETEEENQELSTALPAYTKEEGGGERQEKQEEMSVSKTYVREVRTATTTTTTTLASSSSSGPPSADSHKGEEKDEVEEYLGEVSRMSDKVTALTTKTHSLPPYQQARQRHEALEEEVSSLEPDVATVISRGDTLTLTTHTVDIQRAHNIRVAVNDLRSQWSALKARTEAQKVEADKVSSEIDTVSGRANAIISWCNDVSKRLHVVNNDEKQLAALEAEMAQKKQELDALNESGALLKRYRYTQIQPVLTLLNMRWTEISMQFRQYRKGSLEKKTVVEETMTTTSTTTTSTAAPVSSSDLLANIAKLRESIAASSKQLSGPKLATNTPYHDLKLQEEELKSIKEGLSKLKPEVDKVEAERETLTRQGSQVMEEDVVRRAGDKLREEWAQVNRGYTERHTKWLQCSENWMSLHKTVDEFGVWLSSAEERVKTTSTQMLPDSKTTQKELEKQVTLKHRPSQTLQTTCKEVVEGMEVEEGRKLQEKVDGLMKRWKALLLDLAARRERIAEEEGGKEAALLPPPSPPSGVIGGVGEYETLVNWVEQVEALMAAPVNVTDEASLSAHSTMVQNHLQELPSKQVMMRKVKEGKGKSVTPAQLTSLDTRLTKVAQTLPDYKNKVETKLGIIKTLCQEVEDIYRWTEEMRVKVALRSLSQEEVRAARGVLREKEAMFENLDTTYWVLAQDVEGKGLAVSVALKNRVTTIEERLKALETQLSEASPAVSLSSSHAVEGGAEGGAAPQVGSTVTANVTSVIKDVMKLEETVLREGQDVRPPSPLVSPPRHPPDSSPVLILASLDKSILQIRDWLTLMEQMSRQQTVVVGEADEIRSLTEKQKNVLRELESKKPQLDDLVSSADGLKEDASRSQLHQKVSKLREHWDETNSVVLARKTQLDAMLSDTHKFDSKRAELEAWLGRMEARLERMAPVARTADVLDQQIREQKGFHAEIHQYKHQLELFNQMTQRLIAVYQHDDTRRLKKITETVNFRYSSLNASIIARGKELHSAINSLHNFDKALDKFASWMSEMESGSEVLEGEVDKLGPPPPGRGHPLHHPHHPPRTAPSLHLKDLQSEIESHKDVLASLNATGQKLLGTLENQEEAVMLQRRLEEMNHRWNTLKHKSIAIRNRLEGNSENWTTLLLSLRELIEWVIRKDTELTALGPLVGDLQALSKYSEDLGAYRRVIEEKQPVIESNLKSGRQLIASEPPLSDTSDSEAGRELDGDARYRGDETARDLTRAVRREVAKLSEKWAGLRERVAATTSHTDLAQKKLGVLQKTVEDVSSRVEEAERIVDGWGSSVPHDPNLADQHAHNVKKFREGLVELQRGVDDVNDQAARFSAHSVPLTPANSAKLHDLNTRWKNLETTVNDRWRQVAGRSREVTPLTPAQLASSVSPPWERATTTNKVPYYINHDQESTHWDHPIMMDILDSLTEFNHIKFSAYRTATKLRVLQKKLALDKAKMQTATDIFDEHGLRGQNDRLIDVGDMVVVLSALYGTISADHPDLDTTLAMDLCLNWLLNVYDSQRTGQMRVLSFKIGLVCLCTGHLEEKYRYMFRLIADPNRLVDQRKLGLLLHDCVQVPRQLGEVAAFGGSNIEPSVRSCFTKAGKDRETIEAVHFLAWVQQEPQSLVWLAVLHRVAASESIQHQVKCNICKAYPILGLRYRCLKCLSFDMCQDCFFDGRSGKSHKITHPMHEYCTATTAGEDVKDFTKALKNKFKSKRSLQKHTKKGYLPVQTVLEGDPLESPSPSPQHNVTSQDMHSRLEMYASRLAEVELRTNSNSTPDSEDEHGLIAQYCQSLSSSDAPLPVPRSPLQIMAAVDADQKDELEQMIRALEEENSVLQAEYDRLKSQQPVGSPPEDGLGGPQRSEAEMLAEAKLLRQHKGRLEARMGILEEHNRQLEAQLHRLRQLLGESGGLSSPSKSGTLQTKSVTASQLAMDSPAKVNGHSTHGELGKAVGTLVATMNQEQVNDLPSEEEDEEEEEQKKKEKEEEQKEDSKTRQKEDQKIM